MASPSLDKWKEQAAIAKARAAKTARKAGESLSELRKKNAAKMREQTQQTRMATTAGLVGAHATAVVAGQVDRELSARDKAGLARIINYAAGAGGVALAIYGKSPTMRTVGASLAGMSIYQAGKDTSMYDLVPGFNPEAGG